MGGGRGNIEELEGSGGSRGRKKLEPGGPHWRRGFKRTAMLATTITMLATASTTASAALTTSSAIAATTITACPAIYAAATAAAATAAATACATVCNCG